MKPEERKKYLCLASELEILSDHSRAISHRLIQGIRDEDLEEDTYILDRVKKLNEQQTRINGECLMLQKEITILQCKQIGE